MARSSGPLNHHRWEHEQLGVPESFFDGIPELDADPASPDEEDAWVLRSGSGAIPDGTPIGLLLALTYTGNSGAAFTYEFSYRTQAGTTVRATLA